MYMCFLLPLCYRKGDSKMPKTSEYLTAMWIDRVRPTDDKEQKRRDKEIPSLYFRVRSKSEGGSKSWVLIYTDPETRRRKNYVLEDIPPNSKCWELAKTKAREALHLIQTQGMTPRALAAERQETQHRLEEEAKRKALKIKDLIPLYEPFISHLKRPDEIIRELTNIGKSNLGAKPISQLTVQDLNEFIAQASDLGNTKRTINKKITMLYGLVNKLHKKQVISEEDVRLPPKPEKQAETDSSHDRRYFQPDERKALIEAAKNTKSPWLYPAIILSLNTGIRPQSLFSLIWRDIDWNSNTLLLRAEHMKTKDTWRIPLNQNASDVLKKRKEYLIDKGHYSDDALIFSTRRYLSVHRHDWNNAFRKLVQEAGLDPTITWYNMRHDFASRLVMAGVSLYTVKELMCHKNITTTQVYAHLAPDLKSAAVRLLEKL